MGNRVMMCALALSACTADVPTGSVGDDKSGVVLGELGNGSAWAQMEFAGERMHGWRIAPADSLVRINIFTEDFVPVLRVVSPMADPADGSRQASVRFIRPTRYLESSYAATLMIRGGASTTLDTTVWVTSESALHDAELAPEMGSLYDIRLDRVEHAMEPELECTDCSMDCTDCWRGAFEVTMLGRTASILMTFDTPMLMSWAELRMQDKAQILSLGIDSGDGALVPLEHPDLIHDPHGELSHQGYRAYPWRMVKRIELEVQTSDLLFGDFWMEPILYGSYELTPEDVYDFTRNDCPEDVGAFAERLSEPAACD